MTDSIFKKTQHKSLVPNESLSVNAIDYPLSFSLDFQQSRESAFRAFVVLRDHDFETQQPTEDANGWHVGVTLQLFGERDLTEQIEQLDQIALQFKAHYLNSADDQTQRNLSIIEMEKSGARLAFSNGLFDVCVRKVEKMLASGQMHPNEGLHLLGRAKMLAGKLDEAKTAFQKQLSHCLDARNRGETQCYLADCYAMENDFAKAEEYWIESLATPSVHQAHYGLARCRARIGHSKQAIYWLKMACQAVPSLRDAAAHESDFLKIAKSPEFRRIISPSRLAKFWSALKKSFRFRLNPDEAS